MPRKGSAWRRILDLPPIDWALLAAERSNKGRRHTPKTIAKLKAARAKHEKDRMRHSSKIGKYKAIRKATPGAGERFLCAMRPGEWYGVSDVARLSGVNPDSAKAYADKFRKAGLIERTENPAFERPGGLECQYLFRRVLDQQMANDIADQGKRGDAAE